MHVKKIISILSLSILLTSCFYGCSTNNLSSAKTSISSTKKSNKKIVVLAAASLTESFNEIATNFKKDTGISVSFDYAGSQQLESLINQGTTADVFASASTKNMDNVKNSKLVSSPAIFVKNKIVVCENKNSKIKISKLSDLGQSGLNLVIADKSVPVGQYFYKVLDSNNITSEEKSHILNNVKSNELNVKDVVSKVLLGEADAGIVYKTDINKQNMSKLNTIDLKEFNSITAKYPISVINSSKDKSSAKRFINYVMSNKGRTILKNHGFTLP
ncbi:molybdate ABC transporter substrate-binding protein [Clostridium felsineum]|uniref:Molybdate-binding protein ModA n=1 Tax=Clostridium felsineum TaxID=36839 RepID=A0A1S8LPG7_9CLOT|nr:molybdate ABC transporter substrate-binding protein [Clostridium felsineum]MCR3761748.1 molybdate ABC transporter substrate-binding protein [Clostridium felsineum]URZ02439.1 Molybdate-binding protein ModA [Clostridium felsineum]URZ04821.1 Molybdate-binding protein ModA [Clostridium felsineum]URZ09862.1 Molybdate-binding protein ModA [Clostridium felsineum]URZ18229.1 Molybdate-binding protein ModA [Clostridium felsineum DSM 794]